MSVRAHRRDLLRQREAVLQQRRLFDRNDLQIGFAVTHFDGVRGRRSASRYPMAHSTE
jgi:hypothetical protein